MTTCMNTFIALFQLVEHCKISSDILNKNILEYKTLTFGWIFNCWGVPELGSTTLYLGNVFLWYTMTSIKMWNYYFTVVYLGNNIHLKVTNKI